MNAGRVKDDDVSVTVQEMEILYTGVMRIVVRYTVDIGVRLSDTGYDYVCDLKMLRMHKR